MPFDTFACPQKFAGKVDLILKSKDTKPIQKTQKSQIERACTDFNNPSDECKNLLNNRTVVTGFPEFGAIHHLAKCMKLQACKKTTCDDKKCLPHNVTAPPVMCGGNPKLVSNQLVDFPIYVAMKKPNGEETEIDIECSMNEGILICSKWYKDNTDNSRFWTPPAGST